HAHGIVEHHRARRHRVARYQPGQPTSRDARRTSAGTRCTRSAPARRYLAGLFETGKGTARDHGANQPQHGHPDAPTAIARPVVTISNGFTGAALVGRETRATSAVTGGLLATCVQPVRTRNVWLEMVQEISIAFRSSFRQPSKRRPSRSTTTDD